MHVETCYFHEGVHYGPAGCYHETVAEPEEMQPGWTAQRAANPIAHYKNDGEIRDP